MATKKELVEAYQFSRRRLVTAFLSGAPGGREVEPTKPARSLVGGIALAVLLCAGAGVAGYLGGRPNSNWKSEGSFVISKDTGEQYVVLRGGSDPVIQRVPNFISGQLLLGTPEPDVYSVKDEHIRAVRLGGDLGIEGAPAGLPAPEELVNGGWTACTAAEHGVKVVVAARSQAEAAPEAGFVVRGTGGDLWLLAASPQGPAYRFELPGGATARSTLLDALGFGAASAAPEVSDDWLNLFPLGPALTQKAFGVTRVGQPVDYAASEGGTDLSGYRIGDLLEVGDSHYLLADEAPQILDEFPALVYAALVQDPQPLTARPRARLDEAGHPEEWPAAAPVPAVGQEMCALLRPDEDAGSTHTVPALEPTEDASAVRAEVSTGAHEVVVEPSGGAYVLSGGDAADAGGSPYVVDAKGLRYALLGPGVAEYIGYGDVDPPIVPDAWLGWFTPGVDLSVDAARRLPQGDEDGAG